MLSDFPALFFLSSFPLFLPSSMNTFALPPLDFAFHNLIFETED